MGDTSQRPHGAAGLRWAGDVRWRDAHGSPARHPERCVGETGTLPRPPRLEDSPRGLTNLT